MCASTESNRPDAAEIASQEERDRHQSNHGQPTILLVTNSSNFRREIRPQLEQVNNCRLLEAANGREAIVIARRERITLAIIDFTYSMMDSFIATHVIRQQAEPRYVPIVAIADFDAPGCRTMAHSAGCDEFIARPIDGGHLIELLKHLCDRFS